MNLAAAELIAKAVLYEGYLLYPYRPSSLKNRQRWTFGGLAPAGGAGPTSLETQCLVRGDEETVIEAQVRFLHLLERHDPEMATPWEEAVERRVVAPDHRMGDLLGAGREIPFACPGSRGIDGKISRVQQPVAGVLELGADRMEEGLFRIIASVRNTGEASPPQDSLRSLMSTHLLLGARGGGFLSAIDPPEAFRASASACRNRGSWPVLVGPAGACDTILASPIILEDYPRIAPESPGDLFDATEIDEILSLRILALTDEERRQMGAADPRARALLERTEALGPAGLMKLHGAFRELPPSWAAGEPPGQGLASWKANGTVFEPGVRVRLHPSGRADIFDLVLEGRTATVESIEQDFEDRVLLSVTVDDDPGRDLGADGMPGHRFFFRPEEVERLP
jgi:hypothetical protein